MKNSKLHSIISLSIATVITLTACGAKEPAPGKSSEPKTEVSKEQTSIAESKTETVESTDPIKLTVWNKAVDNLDLDACAMSKVLEEKFNVDLEFITFSSSADAATQYNLMLASGEFPDIILAGQKTPAQINAGITAGALLPLNEFIVEGTNYRKILDENPGWEERLTANDGNIYAFPNNTADVANVAEYKMWYQTEWLEKLGWDAPPATTEEFKEYLIQIRDTDVNGNGDASDEIPIMGYYNGRKTDPICFLMSPFELYTDEYYYITNDGELHFSATTDAWRKGLAYIADLYAEGLIAEETYIQDDATFKGILNRTGEETLVGMFPSYANATDVKIMSRFIYQTIPPLKGDYQQTAARLDGRLQMMGCISTHCENPEAAFTVLDYLLSEEGTRMYLYGIEGESYEWVNEESLAGNTPAIKALDVPWREFRWNWAHAAMHDSYELRYAGVNDESQYEIDTKWMYLKAARNYEPYYVDQNIPSFVWAEDDVITGVAEYSTLINDYIKVSDTEFIMGIRDINDDAQWKAYLDQLDAMGLPQYIELLNAYYALD